MIDEKVFVRRPTALKTFSSFEIVNYNNNERVVLEWDICSSKHLKVPLLVSLVHLYLLCRIPSVHQPWCLPTLIWNRVHQSISFGGVSFWNLERSRTLEIFWEGVDRCEEIRMRLARLEKNYENGECTPKFCHLLKGTQLK